jgi:hypothetical protein
MYYPKSEILLVSNTPGTELLVKKTKKPYTGDYYLTNDNRFFSGKEYTLNTQELVPVQKKAYIQNESKSYGFHYAMPSVMDYERGFFVRYVIKRVNSGFETILEVDRAEHDRAKKDPLYTAATFSWKISGEMNTNKLGVPGIVETNQKTLQELEKTIPGITNYFINLAQYAK